MGSLESVVEMLFWKMHIQVHRNKAIRYIYGLSTIYIISVPNAPCPMMRHFLFACQFPLFHCIVKKEIDEDGIYLGPGMISYYLTTNQLHTPYTATCGVH